MTLAELAVDCEAAVFVAAIPGTGRLLRFTVYALTDSSRSSRASQYCFSRTSVWCFKKNQNSVWPPIQLPYRKDSSKGIPHILLHRYRNGGGVRNSARLGHDIDQSGASIRWSGAALIFTAWPPVAKSCERARDASDAKPESRNDRAHLSGVRMPDVTSVAFRSNFADSRLARLNLRCH